MKFIKIAAYKKDMFYSIHAFSCCDLVCGAGHICLFCALSVLLVHIAVVLGSFLLAELFDPFSYLLYSLLW